MIGAAYGAPLARPNACTGVATDASLGRPLGFAGDTPFAQKSLGSGRRRADALMVSEVLHIPSLWSVARRSIPSFVEGKLAPIVLFLVFLRLVGTIAALLVALGWSVGIIGYRLSRRQRVPGLVVLSAVGLAVRTGVALLTGSMVVYFLQPTATTALVGLVFLFSVIAGRPLAERLAHDFVPFEAETAAHPHLQQFFGRVSLLWAGTSLLNAAITLWLLLTQSATTFVIVKSLLGPATTALTLMIAVAWFRRSLRRQGIRLAVRTPLASLA